MQKILIVEDDEKLRDEIEIFFDHNGYETESLKKFDNTIQDIIDINPDLVLLDINLPGADGEYVCKEVRKQSNVPIIIITSRDNEVDELLSINYGADHYITKPFNIQILLAKTNSLLRRSSIGNAQDKINAKDFINELQTLKSPLASHLLNDMQSTNIHLTEVTNDLTTNFLAKKGFMWNNIDNNYIKNLIDMIN